MRLLVRPLPFEDESTQGYVLRLSTLNGFDRPAWVSSLATAAKEAGEKGASLSTLTGHDDATLAMLRGPIHSLGILNIADRGTVTSRYWNMRFQRYCPICLAEEKYHRAVWGLAFGVACHKHAVWLRDECHLCGRFVGWGNSLSGMCFCGASLEAAPTIACTDNVSAYTHSLSFALYPSVSGTPAPPARIPNLNLEELLRLTWFLGAYSVRQTPKAQKISGVMQLEHAIAMVKATCEVLWDWPGGFHRLVDRIRSENMASGNGNKLSAQFGRFYHTLYNNFPEPKFEFMRRGFESYIGCNWAGQMAKRNRRFSPESLESHEWISLKAAAKILHVRTSVVKQLVDAHVLVGQFFPTPSGRQMGSILKASVAAAAKQQDSSLTLKGACETYGLSRKRLYKLIASGHLNALKGPSVDGSSVWRFERAALEAAIDLAQLPPKQGNHGGRS